MVLCRSHKVRLFQRLSRHLSQVKERKGGLVALRLWPGDLVTLRTGSEPSRSGPRGGSSPVSRRDAGPRSARGGLPQPGGRPGEPGPPGGGGPGRASRGHPLPSTPGVALRHGRGVGLMPTGKQELDVKAGREETSSGIYRGASPSRLMRGRSRGRQRQWIGRWKLSNRAPQGMALGGKQVPGFESQLPTRWSPGRFRTSLVLALGFEAVFSKSPALGFPRPRPGACGLGRTSGLRGGPLALPGPTHVLQCLPGQLLRAGDPLLHQVQDDGDEADHAAVVVPGLVAAQAVHRVVRVPAGARGGRRAVCPGGPLPDLGGQSSSWPHGRPLAGLRAL